ncbi:hypothetical protein ACKWTF_000819 [Chironomus riparius]
MQSKELIYMNIIWSAAPVYAMNMIEITQRKALRILFNKDWFCSKKELYSINILPVSTLCNVNHSLHVFKISSNVAKNNIQIRQVNDVHRYRTRTREHFVTQLSNALKQSGFLR